MVSLWESPGQSCKCLVWKQYLCSDEAWLSDGLCMHVESNICCQVIDEKLLVNTSFGLWPKQQQREVGLGTGQYYVPSQHCSKHAAIFKMPNTTRPASDWNNEKASKVSELVPCASTCH